MLDSGNEMQKMSDSEAFVDDAMSADDEFQDFLKAFDETMKQLDSDEAPSDLPPLPAVSYTHLTLPTNREV